MTIWERWVKRPQSVWLRKALFQVHLWTGIALSLYVFVVCVSGSAAVFNSELYTAFTPKPPIVAMFGPHPNRAELRALAQRVYAGATVTRVTGSGVRNPQEAAEVTIDRGGNRDQRFLDPYTGKDLGTARPAGLRMVGWFSQLHMNLLMGYTGRLMNGVGGFLSTLLCVSGLIIWWPGIQRWRRSLSVHLHANPKRLNWDLHNAVGFWTLAIVFMWAITGAYLVFPKPFNLVLDLVPLADGGRLSLTLGHIPHAIHVGNFAGWPIKALWVVLGLAPPLLVVTGCVMWWNRVVRPVLAKRSLGRLPAIETAAPQADRFVPSAVQAPAGDS